MIRRILVTGSRKWTDWKLLGSVLEATYAGLEGPKPRLVHGGAQGADKLAGWWARAHGVRCEVHPAQWDAPCTPQCPPDHRKERWTSGTYCPLAGHRRNQLMVDLKPLLVLAFQVDGSTGTKDCVDRAKAAGIPVTLTVSTVSGNAERPA